MFKKIFQKSSKKSENDVELHIIYSIIKDLNPKIYNKNSISRETRFDSLGFNSMMYIRFLVKLEDATKLDLEQIANVVDFAGVETIGDMVDILQSTK